MDRRSRICQHMLRLGVPAHRRGYRYIVEAVDMLLTCPESVNRLTAVVYPTVGLRYNTNGNNVERAIRTAVEYVFSNTDMEVLYEYFGNSVDQQRGKATNGHFIMTLAERVRLEEHND